jgi:hypothetical protein
MLFEALFDGSIVMRVEHTICLLHREAMRLITVTINNTVSHTPTKL